MSRLGNLWKRAFGKAAPPAAPSPIIDARRMNEDWKVGDDAVCVDDDWHGAPNAPRKGDRLRVNGITSGVAFGTNILIYGLAFAGRPPHQFWHVDAFRKLHPDGASADAEFVADVRRRAQPKVDA